MNDDTRDKLIRLETEVDHLTVKVDEMSRKVGDMHDLLMQARGARWAIIGLATTGGFVAAKLASFIPWMTAPLPR
jgi:hypothetical protein